MPIRNLPDFTDADGTFPVSLISIYYADGSVVRTDAARNWNDFPPIEVQAVSWVFFKDGRDRFMIWCGLETDPTIYTVGGREFLGSLIGDSEYETIRQQATQDAIAARN